MSKLERNQGKETENPVTKRAIFENEDGTVRYLEGDDLQKWEKVMSGLVMLGYTHRKQGQKELEGIQWKTASSLQELQEKTA